MPTVILFDVSLSMCKNINLLDSSEVYSVKSLAVFGLNCLIDYISSNTKLEFISLMLFSSLWERNISFTRDFEAIRTALNNLETFYDKTNIINALKGVQELVLEEWGTNIPCNILLITDGNPGISAYSDFENLEKSTFRFSFPAHLHIINLCSLNDPFTTQSITYFKKIIELTSPNKGNNLDNQLWIPENMSLKSVSRMFMRLGETNYTSYRGTLHCGSLSSEVLIYPPIENCTQLGDFESYCAKPSSDIHICGFMNIEEISSPPVYSRHLVFSISWQNEESSKFHSVLTINPSSNFDISSATASDIEEVFSSLFADEGRQPSLCVLLHGSLKVEGMVAICKLGEPDWYGMLYSWAESKKKSNLMLSTFNCGLSSVAWLGNLSFLGLSNLSIKLNQNEINKIGEKKSYSRNCVVWIKQSSLQSDIQKVLRLAKRLPDKMSNFYKELNRFRKAALTIGFYEIIEGLAKILERECTLLPGTAHPEAALQLTHAASALRSLQDLDSLETTISPLKTLFNTS